MSFITISENAVLKLAFAHIWLAAFSLATAKPYQRFQSDLSPLVLYYCEQLPLDMSCRILVQTSYYATTRDMAHKHKFIAH
jgi:hypothetical protein